MDPQPHRAAPLPPLLALLLALLLAPLLAAGCGGDTVEGVPLTPGLVTVGSRTVETSSGGPTTGTVVVFEAGEGDSLDVWSKAAPLVGIKHRVFLYSRAGYGRSTPTTAPRDAATIVGELRALLTAAAIPLPIVLVAHSNSSLYAELYAKTHASELAGMVLLEPRHRDFTAECEAAILGSCELVQSEIDALPDPFKAEYQALQADTDELHAIPPGMGDLPLRVLTGAGVRVDTAAWMRLWTSLHQQLAAESTRGKQEGAPDAGHFIQLDNPGSVASAVDEVFALLP